MGLNDLLGMKETIDSKEGRLTVLALIMMMYVMAMFFSILIHEIVGHGLFTMLLGGEFYAVYISPGSGFASLWFPPTMSNNELGLIYLAGILVQLVIGTLVLALVFPRIKNPMTGLFTLMFCIGMLVHSSLYLAMGYYYSGGDTLYAANIMGIEPEAFLVVGIMIAGFFVIMISHVALKFLGKFMDLSDERTKSRTLALIWFPHLLLNGIFSLVYSFTASATDFAYPFLNAVLLLMFIALALFLVPLFSEPEKEREYSITMKSILSVIICFTLLLAGWAGVFGLSRETAHGLVLQDPPVQAEIYYSDYTVGNAELMVFANGTVRIDIILRNRMGSPSPMENKIYHSFDNRPDWDRYVARSRNMLMTMFHLPRDVGENLSFSTDYDTVWVLGTGDDLGRRCTTWLDIGDIGTRQSFITPGDLTYQPGMGLPESDITLNFADPWFNQKGYLDEVRISWENELEVVGIQSWNVFNMDIPYNQSSTDGNLIVWENSDIENAPSGYIVKFDVI